MSELAIFSLLNLLGYINVSYNNTGVLGDQKLTLQRQGN